MIARELMTRHFPYVTADADLDYVARVLAECEVGVVPVVDDTLKPIGIITRSNLEKASRALPAADLGQIPEFLLRNRARPAFRGNGDGRALREIMSAPAISVPLGATLADVAKVMEAHNLKRAPVVDGQKLVGVLLRREVLTAIAGKNDATPAAPAKPVLSPAQPEPQSCDIATAEEFRGLVAKHEQALDEERNARLNALRELREQHIKELAALRLTEARWREMLSLARRAAVSGQSDCQLIRFPSQLCTDGGRAINAPDPHWPETLRGEPADVYRRWRNELHPRGFRIGAQIIDFPQGLPGDGALFLIWGKPS